jgi:hypothetical protein
MVYLLKKLLIILYKFLYFIINFIFFIIFKNYEPSNFIVFINKEGTLFVQDFVNILIT